MQDTSENYYPHGVVHLRRYIVDGFTYHLTSATYERVPEFRSDSSARILVDAIQFLRPTRALVLAYAVMPDHFHLLVQPSNGWKTSQIMQTVKGYSSRRINERKGRRGRLRQQSFYDRVIRGCDQLLQCIDYIHWNPVKAKLIEEPRDYRSSAFPGVSTDIEEFLAGSRRG